MTPERFQTVTSRYQSLRIAVVGDFCLDRYLEIERDLGLKAGMASALEELRHRIETGATKDFVASRGEYLCGLLMAAFLGAEFVDPAETVYFDKSGRITFWELD